MFSIGLDRAAIAATLAVACGAWAPRADAQATVQGVVYDDRNGNGAREAGEAGVRGVGVSNGREVVRTDSAGRYELPLEPDSIVFVIKPSGWRTAVDADQLPRFHYIHKPAGSPQSRFEGVAPTGPIPPGVDFPLYRQTEPDTFSVIFFGDTQPRNVEEVNYIAHDVVEELVGSDAAFGVTLGDIVFNDLSVFPVLNGVVGRIGIPWYNVIGNHDLNMDTDNDALSDETFERIYGPAYYAFNHGKVHFIVLDNVAWDSAEDGYHGEIGERQLAFVRNDLESVPRDRLVVVMMHIPLNTVDDRADLLAILAERPNSFSISAHWHRQGNYFLTESGTGLEGHHHLVHGTVSGSWWSGLKDEFGVPHAMMSDGTPNGYSIGKFDGANYSLKYKAARRPPEFQMSIFAPESVKSGESAQHEIVANVFLGSLQSRVEMRVGSSGDWCEMKVDERVDPYFQDLKDREFFLPPAAGRKLPDAAKSTHVWVADLPENVEAGTHVIYVRTTDMFGQTFYGHRIIRVE
jgi:hypothetical protein